MRIGTWNFEGRWSHDHIELLTQQGCDVWLLTEVPTDAVLPGFGSHRSGSMMAAHKHWAGVFSKTPPDRVIAEGARGQRLSDHDAYVTEVTRS